MHELSKYEVSVRTRLEVDIVRNRFGPGYDSSIPSAVGKHLLSILVLPSRSSRLLNVEACELGH